jgi:hypothetical protein
MPDIRRTLPLVPEERMGQLSRLVHIPRQATAEHRAHAVVIGAGVAGLLAARVLADQFEPGDDPRPRPGPRPARVPACALVPIEGGCWMVALIGAGCDYPPTDDTGFLEFARGLRSPLLYQTIKDAEPRSPIYSYRNTDNQRRHFERLRRWPERFVVIGDGGCSFNPIYAQGMSVAAMIAVDLGHALARQRRRSGADLAGMARQFQRQVARTNAGAWTMATSEDLSYPWTEGARLDLPTRIMHRYADRVLEVANGNSKVNTAFVNVVNLRYPPTSLLRPGVLLPVLARHRAPPLTNPPTARQAPV